MDQIRRAISYARGEGLGPFLLRAVAGSGAVQLAGRVMTFFVGIQLARGLGVSGYGYYGIATAIITLAAIPGAMGIPKLVTREVAAAQSRGDVAGLYAVLRWADRTCWRISAAIAVVVAGAALIALWIGSTTLGAAILLGAPMIALLPLANIRGGALRGLHRVVLGQLATIVLRPLAVSLFLFIAFSAGIAIGAPAAMAIYSIATAGALLLTSWWLTAKLPARTPAAASIDGGRRWLASSIPMALTEAINTLQMQLAVLVLGFLAAPSEVGLLRVATATAIVVGVPVTVVNVVVLPMFATLNTEGDRAGLQKLVTFSARIQFAGVLVLALPLLIAAGPLLGLVFGGSYVPAGDALRVLAVGAIISAGFGPNGALLNMTGHERRVTRAVSTALIVNVVLIALLASKWGSVGTSIGVVAGQLCWNMLLWLDARRLLRVETSALRLPVTAASSQTDRTNPNPPAH